AIEASPGRDHDGVERSEFELVSQLRICGINVARGIDWQKFQKVRPHGKRCTFMPDQGQRDKAFRRDEPFTLNHGLRKLSWQLPCRRRSIRVCPAADQAQARPEHLMTLRRSRREESSPQ